MHSSGSALFAVALTLVGCSAKPDRAAESRQAPTESATPYEDLHGKLNCPRDCSALEEGYRWAQANRALSTQDCGGGSEAFIEGCRSYVEDQTTK